MIAKIIITHTYNNLKIYNKKQTEQQNIKGD